MPSSVDLTEPDWTLVDFTVARDSAEIVSDALWGLGVVAVEEIENDSLTVLRTSMGEDPDAAVRAMTARFPGLVVSRVDFPRSVADAWREHAVPTWVSDNVWLVPAWVAPPADASAILVEPFDTFGLGNHPTTILALRLALAHTDLTEDAFDLGCGSGVLAVAITKLRGTRCYVYDIADNAQRAVLVNASLNDVAAPTWVQERPSAPVRTVLANILAPVLIERADTIVSSTTPGGCIVLSGMRTDQVSAVVEAYRDAREVTREEIDGWTAVVLRRV